MKPSVKKEKKRTVFNNLKILSFKNIYVFKTVKMNGEL